MSPSVHLPSQYLHLLTPILTLAPASGDEGEFVALPLIIQDLLAVVDHMMCQLDNPSATRRNFPSFFMKTGRPSLHIPSTNLFNRVLTLELDYLWTMVVDTT